MYWASPFSPLCWALSRVGLCVRSRQGVCCLYIKYIQYPIIYAGWVARSSDCRTYTLSHALEVSRGRSAIGVNGKGTRRCRAHRQRGRNTQGCWSCQRVRAAPGRSWAVAVLLVHSDLCVPFRVSLSVPMSSPASVKCCAWRRALALVGGGIAKQLYKRRVPPTQSLCVIVL